MIPSDGIFSAAQAGKPRASGDDPASVVQGHLHSW